MGTTSAYLFGSDIACVIRADYGQYLRWGMTGREATRQVLDDWADELSDQVQDGPVVWLALAVTQWKYGRLQPRVKAKALKIIKSGGDVDAFPLELHRRRISELNRLRLVLESPQPPEKRVRVSKQPKPPAVIEEFWRAGQVVAYRRDSGQWLLLATEGICEQIPHFLILDWAGTKLPGPDRIRKLRAIRFAISAYPNLKGEPIPWDRIRRLDITRDSTGFIHFSSFGVGCLEGLHDFRWAEFEAFLSENADSLKA